VSGLCKLCGRPIVEAYASSMNTFETYEALLKHSRELALLQSCSAVLGWDQQTYIPRGASEYRGEQLGLLARLIHERATNPVVGEWLQACEGSELVQDPHSIPAANVRELRHVYTRATKLPSRLVEELAKVTSDAHEIWAEARKQSQFQLFQPTLERILALKREEAAVVGYADHPYDALLDEYEPGATAAELRPVFADLATQLVPLIANAPVVPDKILERELPIDRQRWFAEAAAMAIGFDFQAGRLDTTTHPFCTTLGPRDCRITTRFNSKFFNEAFFGVLHETGHGLYEQGLLQEHYGTPCGSYCSLGVHESQSRLWENQVGRSMPFWEHFFPRLKQAFPNSWDDVKLEQFWKAINAVQPSFIRVEADEATYNLHIILRFELELELISGNLPVADLPEAWNSRFKKLFGLTVPTDREGCLQDIHWSFGGLGYFPTYTLGNLMAAQLMEAAEASQGADSLEKSMRQGEFAPLLSWLRNTVHVHGRRYRATDLCRRATGQPLNSRAFLAYLSRKLHTMC
jgi:carboxypeptidase Taq